MSIFSKINRIVTLRNGIRNRLVTFGIVNSSAKLEDCKTALEGIVDNTKKTSSYSYIQGAFHSGKVGSIFGKVGEGYCSANSVVSIPVPNLYPENIKKGVIIGGVVGTCKPFPVGSQYIEQIDPTMQYGFVYRHDNGTFTLLALGYANSDYYYDVYYSASGTDFVKKGRLSGDDTVKAFSLGSNGVIFAYYNQTSSKSVFRISKDYGATWIRTNNGSVVYDVNRTCLVGNTMYIMNDDYQFHSMDITGKLTYLKDKMVDEGHYMQLVNGENNIAPDSPLLCTSIGYGSSAKYKIYKTNSTFSYKTLLYTVTNVSSGYSDEQGRLRSIMRSGSTIVALFVGDYQSFIGYSKDNGSTWNKASLTLPGISDVYGDLYHPYLYIVNGVFYVVDMEEKNLYRSYSGSSWSLECALPVPSSQCGRVEISSDRYYCVQGTNLYIVSI